MSIPKDKLQHLAGGAVALAGFLLLVWVERNLGLPASIAAAGPMVGGAIEAYQYIRRSGAVDPWDALATAVPFEVAAFIFWGTT